jgi:hypothetical protein
MLHSNHRQPVSSATRVGLVLGALTVALVAVAIPVQAQNRAKVSIDFAFVAGGVAMDAGDFELETTGTQMLIMRPTAGKGKPVMMKVITRLGRHDNDQDPELVFDKVDGKFCLSEFWFPNLDGFLVLNTPVDHEHRVLGGSHPHK